MRNAGGIGLTFYYPKSRVPPGLISRGPEFATHMGNRTQCLTDIISQGISDKKVSLNYGTSCGTINKLGSAEGCDMARKKIVKIQNQDREVCADHGTDACCAKHDLIRTGISVSGLATISSCKANNALHNCLNDVK